MFSKPVVQQAVAMTNILDSAQRKFFPRKTLVINPRDQPWVNSYTHLLMQKKNIVLKKKLFQSIFLLSIDMVFMRN